MGSIGAMRRGSRERYFQDAFDLESPAPMRLKSSYPRASKGALLTKAVWPRWFISS